MGLLACARTAEMVCMCVCARSMAGMRGGRLREGERRCVRARMCGCMRTSACVRTCVCAREGERKSLCARPCVCVRTHAGGAGAR